MHQSRDFRLGTCPVFGGEGVEGKGSDIELAGRLHNRADGVHPFFVPFDTVEQTLFGPAAVAVHDDGDVFGHPVGVEFMARDSG